MPGGDLLAVLLLVLERCRGGLGVEKGVSTFYNAIAYAVTGFVHAFFARGIVTASKRSSPVSHCPPNPQLPSPPEKKTYIEKDTELLRIGSTCGLGADHGHGAAGLAQAEAGGSGHTGSRESGRGTQKAHRGLEQQSRSHGHQHSSLEHVLFRLCVGEGVLLGVGCVGWE